MDSGKIDRRCMGVYTQESKQEGSNMGTRESTRVIGKWYVGDLALGLWNGRRSCVYHRIVVKRHKPKQICAAGGIPYNAYLPEEP